MTYDLFAIEGIYRAADGSLYVIVLNKTNAAYERIGITIKPDNTVELDSQVIEVEKNWGVKEPVIEVPEVPLVLQPAVAFSADPADPADPVADPNTAETPANNFAEIVNPVVKPIVVVEIPAAQSGVPTAGLAAPELVAQELVNQSLVAPDSQIALIVDPSDPVTTL
jgi:hypothetical protein